MRFVLGSLAGLITAVGVWHALVLLILVVGGAECDPGYCNRIGEWMAKHSSVVAVAALTVALIAGALVARRVVVGLRR